MSRIGTITRRTFLLGSTAIAGGILFGYYQYKQPYENPLSSDPKQGKAAITPYIKIDATGVTIIAPRAEMGQGVSTTLAVLVAEELDVLLSDIKVEHGPAANAYYNSAVLEEGAPFPPTDTSATAEAVRDFMHVPGKLIGMQITGGSSSTVDAYEKMRVAGAAARDVLLSAAAAKLGVAKSSLSTKDGQVVTASGDSLAYTELATLATEFEPPSTIPLKASAQWQKLGRSQPRTDMLPKVLGSAEFGVDIKQPDLLYATVKMNPHLDGKLLSFDATEAEQMRGVKKVFAIGEHGIAVVATNTWYAFQAAKKVQCQWAKTDYPQSTEALFAQAAASFNDDHFDSRMRDDGDVEQALPLAGNNVISAEYRAPMLAHAPMEPMNATALLKNGKLDIWAGNQIPTQAKREGVILTGLAPANVRVHTPYMGGSFGRRLEMDFIKYAILVAKEMAGTPVKVTWSREEDTTHDSYRPFAIARFKTALEANKVVAFDAQYACPSVTESQMGRLGVTPPGPDATIVQGSWEQAYQFENYRVTGYRVPKSVPVSSWRSVGASQNGFFNESMVDELAHRLKQDPIAMRLAHISDPTNRKVLEAAAELANWGKPLPNNHGMGVALVTSFGVPCAEIIEVAHESGTIKILNAYVVADVGTALDPRNIEAQLMSGLNFGLAAAMMAEITLKDGMVQQTNFHNYDSIRMNQSPNMHFKILQNGERIRGIGEPATPPAAPALANAIFAATGQRLREMPFNKHFQFV